MVKLKESSREPIQEDRYYIWTWRPDTTNKYITEKSMTEREKKEICKGYADLIIKKEQLIREIWNTEFGIRNLEDVSKRNKILMPTPPEEPSETDQVT